MLRAHGLNIASGMTSFFAFFLPLWLLTAAQGPGPIRLQAQALPFTPGGYSIRTVTDQRPDGGPIARLVLVPGRPPAAVDIAGGISKGIGTFVDQSLSGSRQQRPIAMRILQCQLTETAVGNRVSGQFALTVGFDLLEKNDDDSETSTRLTTYRGGATYTRPIDQTTVIEPTIRQALQASLRSLDSYMKREMDHNEKLATNLRVVFTDDSRLTSDDTVHYNPARKLTWADFRATPRSGSHYAAEVFTSFAYEGRSTVEKGTIVLQLMVKTYMLKQSSWGRDASQNPYTLNHEQRHFDIAKLITERFKQKITPANLTLADYNSEVQYQFIESFREMNKLQQRYDDETRHGTDEAAQARWNGQIDAELRRYGLLP